MSNRKNWQSTLRQLSQSSSSDGYDRAWPPLVHSIESELPDILPGFKEEVGRLFRPKRKRAIAELLVHYGEILCEAHQGRLFLALEAWGAASAGMNRGRCRRASLATFVFAEISLLAVEVSLDLHQFESAETELAFLEKAWLTARQRAVYHFVRAVLAYRRREVSNADKALEASRRMMSIAQGASPDYGYEIRTLCLQGQLHMVAGQMEFAEDCFMDALGSSAHSPKVSRTMADIFCKQSRVELRIGKRVGAAESAKQALSHAEVVENIYLKALANQRRGEALLACVDHDINSERESEGDPRGNAQTKSLTAAAVDHGADAECRNYPRDITRAKALKEARQCFLRNMQLCKLPELQNRFGLVMALLKLSHHSYLKESLKKQRIAPYQESRDWMAQAEDAARQLPADHPAFVEIYLHRARLAATEMDYATASINFQMAFDSLLNKGLRNRAAWVLAKFGESVYPTRMREGLEYAAEACQMTRGEGVSPLSNAFEIRLGRLAPRDWLLQFPRPARQIDLVDAEDRQNLMLQGILHAADKVVGELRQGTLKTMSTDEFRAKADRLSHLRDLLMKDYGGDQDQPGLIEVNSLLERVEAYCGGFAQDASLRINMKPSKRGSLYFRGREDILLLALEVLVRNALEHSKTDVELRAKSMRGGKCAVIEVCDHGSGLQPEVASWLSQPRNGDKKPPQRVARRVGLRFARHALVELHKARIVVVPPSNDTLHSVRLEMPSS